MGLEAKCTVRVGSKSGSGKALLEAESLIFRGDMRLRISFDQLRGAFIVGDELVLQTAESEARFQLGAAPAQRWLTAIREPKGLFEKLELQPQSHVAAVDIHDGPFLSALRERSASLAEGRVPQGANVIFFGAESREALRKIAILRTRMPDTGTLWVIRPKGGKEVTEPEVFDALRAAGLVDTKVVSFSRTHTAHKAVIPVALRGKGMPRPLIVSFPPPAPPQGHPAGTASASKVTTSKAQVRPSKKSAIAKQKRDA